jgi:hypothetical protein
METGPMMCTLDGQQFQQALAVLRREQRAYTPSARQEKIFKFLNLAFYGFGVAWLVLLLLLPVMVSRLGFIEARLDVFLVMYAIAVLVLLVLAAGITALFLLNVPYLRRLLRQRRLAHQVGLWEALHAPWTVERRRNRLRGILESGILVVGSVIAVTNLILLLATALGLHAPAVPWIAMTVYLLLFVAGGVLVATCLMRRSREQLGLISRLYSSLEGCNLKMRQDGDRRIGIPTEAYQKIAQIERAQIARDRVESILGGSDEADAPVYVLHKSRAARQAQARLDTTTRLRVQAQIDALTTEPHPMDVSRSPEADAFRLCVPQTSVIIGYTVEDQTRHIHILSVQSASDTAETSSEPGEE